MSELSIIRTAGRCANSGTRYAPSQMIAPAHIAPHNTGRPWKMRAALQIMPQATNSSALEAPTGSGGEITLSTLQITTEKPPIRYAVPHQASARMRSCAQADNNSRPSSAVMQVAMMTRVVMSSDVSAFAVGASMTGPSNIPCYGTTSIPLPGDLALGLCSQPKQTVALFVML